VSKNRIDSPCIKVCSLDRHTGFCQGCFRTPDEIARWSQMDNRERQIVYHNINLRKSSVIFESSDSIVRKDS
jgi:uncharacterized protein